MKVSGFGLYRFRLPLTEPLALGGRTLEHREGLLMKLEGEDGAVGWGEASPLPGFSAEGLADAARGLGELAASAVGREVGDDWFGADGALARTLDRADYVPSVRFGFELAAYSLYAEARGATLSEIVGEDHEDVVPVNGLLAGPPDGAPEEARRMRYAGYGAAKLKVGGRSVEEDVALVRAVSEALGEGVALRLDANRAWGLAEALAFARGIEGARVEYLEEPLADPEGLEDFARASGMPVALDESVVGMAPEALREHRYAAAVVVKPTLVGGLSRALRLAERAEEWGLRCVVSAAYETGVGTAGLVALAAGLGGGVPIGLDTYRRLAGDVVEPRLPLPAPRVRVRETVRAGRGVVPGRLFPEAQTVG